MPGKENPTENQGIRINAELGCEIFIQIKGLKERLSSYLVGIIPGVNLIIKTPQLADIQELLADGSYVVLRYVHLGQIYGFRSKVMRSIISPSRLTFLSYPDNIEKINLRKNARVSCYIPATLTYTDAKIKGVTTNISQSGIKFTTRSIEGLKTNQLPAEDNIMISFPVLGKEGVQEFQGRIRNKSYADKEISLGIEFMKIEKDLSDMINDYIKKVKEYEGK